MAGWCPREPEAVGELEALRPTMTAASTSVQVRPRLRQISATTTIAAAVSSAIGRSRPPRGQQIGLVGLGLELRAGPRAAAPAAGRDLRGERLVVVGRRRVGERAEPGGLLAAELTQLVEVGFRPVGALGTEPGRTAERRPCRQVFVVLVGRERGGELPGRGLGPVLEGRRLGGFDRRDSTGTARTQVFGLRSEMSGCTGRGKTRRSSESLGLSRSSGISPCSLADHVAGRGRRDRRDHGSACPAHPRAPPAPPRHRECARLRVGLALLGRTCPLPQAAPGWPRRPR